MGIYQAFSFLKGYIPSPPHRTPTLKWGKNPHQTWPKLREKVFPQKGRMEVGKPLIPDQGGPKFPRFPKGI